MQMFILQNVKYILQYVETKDLIHVQRTPGWIIMKTPGIFIVVFAVYCICALCIGMSSAADVTAFTVNPNSMFSTGPVHPLSPKTVIATPEHEGINVSKVKIALPEGDNASTPAWLKENRTKCPVVMRAGTGRPGSDLTNATLQQQVISRLREKCVGLTNTTQTIRDGETGRDIAGRNLMYRTTTDPISSRVNGQKCSRAQCH
jgi:hypothetical protein